jgi:hypothetical protein
MLAGRWSFIARPPMDRSAVGRAAAHAPTMGSRPYTFWKLHAGKFPLSYGPERKSLWQGITETWMTGRRNTASLWGTLIRRCITMPPKLDHSRLQKLLSPSLLAVQERLAVIDNKIGLLALCRACRDTAGNGPVPTIARGIRQPYSFHQFGAFPCCILGTS